MRISDKKYLSKLEEAIDFDLALLFRENTDRQENIQLDFRIKTSAVFSANIEGNSMDISSFMNSEVSKEVFKPRKEQDEISDLIAAYNWAIEQPFNETNLLEAHRILSKTILIKDKQGRYRTDRMGVYDNNGLVYLALEPAKVQTEMGFLFSDLQELLVQKLSIQEVFYHASMIHLKLAQIHPFWDGNGRISRLAEKWFLAEKLGESAWKIESEHFYKKHLSDYYKNIHLGMDYYSIDFDQSIPFLRMLVDSLKE